MTNGPIEGLLVETRNYGKTVAFWKALGFSIEFETDHGSGQLRHPGGGPFLFVREVAPDAVPAIVPMVTVEDSAGFEVPPAGTSSGGFVPRHWGVDELQLFDPDERLVSVQTPSRAGR